MVLLTPLLFALPVLAGSALTPPDFVSNMRLAVRQTFDPSSLPSQCQSSCQVVNTMTDCGASLDCTCTSTIGNQLEQCMQCLVEYESSIQSSAQAALDSWNGACGGTLSLDGGSSSGSGTSTTASGTSTATGTTSGTTSPATATSTSPSSDGDGSSDPLSLTGGAVDLKTGGSIAMCVVAALAGASMFL